MSKKNKEFIFSLDGDVLECESILEVKNGVTDEEWQRITSGTVKYLCYARMLKEMGMPLLSEEWDKEDERVLRRMKRTVEYMKKLDPTRMAQFNMKEICDSYAAIILKGVNEIKDLMKEVTGRKATADYKVRTKDL